MHGLMTELVAKWDAKNPDLRFLDWDSGFAATYFMTWPHCHCLGLSFLLRTVGLLDSSGSDILGSYDTMDQDWGWPQAYGAENILGSYTHFPRGRSG